MSARKDFLSQPAPENYVAGLGRGATGFTTRSDLGPAREGPSEEQLKEALAKRAAQLGANAPTAYGVPDKKKEQEEKDDEDDARFADPDNEYGLFAGGLYDKDDEEADQIYAAVTEKMEKRRKARREEREKMERDEYEAKNPKISQQFADAKRALGAVTEEEWANLPEVGDLTGKRKRERAERLANKSYAVPDSVLAGARDAMQIETSISATDALDTADGTMTNFAAIGAARNKLLDARLRQAEQGAGGDGGATGSGTALDQKGYLTSLANVERAGEANIGDISRTRDLLESVTKTNPTSAPGWVSLARLEEYAGKTVAARNAIKKGCNYCPKSDDVWLESIRLHMGGNNHNAKIIVADAIKVNPYSVKLWIAAMELESDPRARKKVLRQALDLVPKSVVLWKAAANLEDDPNDAKLLLAKATEFIPQSVELWLALARLESDKNAAAVLNKARIAIPTSHEIWIAACRLQEQLGKPDLARTVMTRGIQSLAKQSAMLKREEWIEEAEKAESEGALLTCQAIIENTLGWELDEEDDRADVWLQDAKESTGRGRYGTARAMLAYALRVFPKKRKIWHAAVDLERNHGSRTDLLDLLMTAVKAVPDSDDLWLQLARERTQAGELDEARKVLAMAFEENASENIWLAAVKLEADTKNYDQARELLRNARDSARTDRIWIKSVAFERQLGNTDAALDLVNQGLQEHPAQSKLWMMKGQIYEYISNIPKARETYNTGTRACPKSIPLWLLTSRLEEKAGILVKARSTLDKARLANPKSPHLWTESVRLERRANNLSAANNLMAQALQELPSSGLLWSEKIMTLEQRTHRKARALEAAKKCETDPSLYLLYITIARIFWAERKLEKASSWFEKAIVLDPDWGDTWAWYYKFLMMHGTDEKKEDVVGKCVLAEPRHGEVWAGIAKDPSMAGIGVEGVLMKTVKGLE